MGGLPFRKYHATEIDHSQNSDWKQSQKNADHQSTARAVFVSDPISHMVRARATLLLTAASLQYMQGEPPKWCWLVYKPVNTIA